MKHCGLRNGFRAAGDKAPAVGTLENRKMRSLRQAIKTTDNRSCEYPGYQLDETRLCRWQASFDMRSVTLSK